MNPRTEYLLDFAVDKLAKAVCAVAGHQWAYMGGDVYTGSIYECRCCAKRGTYTDWIVYRRKEAERIKRHNNG